jgi:hypothetical protein
MAGCLSFQDHFRFLCKGHGAKEYCHAYGGDKIADLVDIDFRQLESICPPPKFSGGGRVYVG